MNTQEIILILILLTCVLWIIRRIVLCFKKIRKKSSPCQSCPCDCRIRPKTFSEKKKMNQIKNIEKILRIKKNSRTFASAIKKQR